MANTVLTEEEYEEITFKFEEYTESKVRKDNLVTVHDFKMFAQNENYELNKVFCANPWVNTNLTMDAIERIEKAEEKVQINF